MIHRPLEAARKRPKLGWLLALYTCGLIVAAIGATATVVGWQFWEEREARIGEFLDRRAVQLADELASGITDHLRVMRAHAARDDLVDRVTGRGARSAGARNPLDALQAAWPEFMWIGIADRTGRIVAATRDQQLGGDVSEREWFRAGLEGPYLAVPRGGVGERILELAYPMLDDRSQVVGVIAGELPRAWVDMLRKRIGAASAEAMRFDLAVAHADGVPLGGARAALIDLDAPAVERWRAVLGAPPGAVMPYLAGAPLGGEPEVSVLGWYAIASMPRSVLAQETRAPAPPDDRRRHGGRRAAAAVVAGDRARAVRADRRARSAASSRGAPGRRRPFRSPARSRRSRSARRCAACSTTSTANAPHCLPTSGVSRGSSPRRPMPSSRPTSMAVCCASTRPPRRCSVSPPPT